MCVLKKFTYTVYKLLFEHKLEKNNKITKENIYPAQSVNQQMCSV